MDWITDFQVGVDKIQLSTAANAYASGANSLMFSGSTGINVTRRSITANTLADFNTAAGTPIASTNALAHVVDVTVTSGSLAGRYLMIQNTISGSDSVNDTWINITGINGNITASDFAFG